MDVFLAFMQALMGTCKEKAADIDPLSLPLQDRFNLLLEEASSVLASGTHPFPNAGVTGVESDGGVCVGIGGRSHRPALTVNLLADLERMFDTETGVDVANEDLCHFVRASIGFSGQ